MIFLKCQGCNIKNADLGCFQTCIFLYERPVYTNRVTHEEYFLLNGVSLIYLKVKRWFPIRHTSSGQGLAYLTFTWCRPSQMTSNEYKVSITWIAWILIVELGIFLAYQYMSFCQRFTVTKFTHLCLPKRNRKSWKWKLLVGPILFSFHSEP